MELNTENNDKKSKKKDLNKELDQLINEQIEDLKQLNQKLVLSLPDKIQTSFLKELKQKIYHSLYENFSFKNNHKIIQEILCNLKTYFIIHYDGLDPSFIEALESLMMLFLFHFDIKIIKLGLELLKFLIENLEENYSSELIEYFIKIIQSLNIKKQVNNDNSTFISSTIIYNISLGLYIIMSNKQIPNENKKPFFNFIKKNISDINLIYSFFISNDNNSIKYSKIFNNDEIKFIYEKISENLNKTYTDLTNNLPKKKTDVLYIKEKVNEIGFCSKILNSITIEGSRTYLIDKLIKNMIPISQRILDTFKYFNELKNNELKISAETMDNIFSYFKKIGSFSFENVLKVLSFVNKMYDDFSYDYLIIIMHLINELSKIALSLEEKKLKNVTELIIQVIEVVLRKNKAKNNDELKLDIFELYKINQIYNILLKIDSKCIIAQKKFPNTYKFFVEDKNNNYLDGIEKGFNEKNFDYYSQIYLNSIAAGNKDNKYINKNTFLDCFNKFENFKNSIKDSLAIKNGFDIDKLIEKEKREIENKENITYDDFEAFFLKNSMEMFKEIYAK
jgi:hypothetical protein